MKETMQFLEMLPERGIECELFDAAILFPDKIEDHSDGTRHYIRRIAEFGNRWLRVIVNIESVPERCVTAFFDRRLRRLK
jgi:transposase